MIILALIALVVIPPEKLPEFARQIARMFSELKRSTSGVWDDLKQDAMLKPDDLMKYKPPAPIPPPVSELAPTAPVVTAEEKKPHE